MRSLALLLVVASAALVRCLIVPSEIMYHPKQEDDYEYLELHNTGDAAVDLSGYILSDDLSYTFPAGSSIAAGGYVVVARNKAKLLAAYPNLNAGIVFGDSSKRLPDGDGKIKLTTGSTQVFSVSYQDTWYPTTDGYGASLELVCADAQPTGKASWRPSAVPSASDVLREFSGTPGAAGLWTQCPVPTSSTWRGKKVYINEIMYHPRSETTEEEVHEYIELYNDGSSDYQMDNWRLVSASSKLSNLQFSFPANSVIESKSYVVIAKNPTSFKAIYSGSGTVYGPYSGELGNGGDRIALLDSNDMVIEEVQYDDAWPWPTGADSSVGDQFKGMSLQRVSYDYDASKKYNWIAAAGTPGAQNNQKKDTPDPVVTEMWLNQSGATPKILKAGKVDLAFKIMPTADSAALEYFMYNTQTMVAGSTTTVSMKKLSDADDIWGYSISGLAANTIVRYRVKANDAVISPRKSDSAASHGFHIPPADATDHDAYHLYIEPVKWGSLYNNLRTDLYLGWGLYTDLPEQCCTINPLWNNDVDAVFAYQGQVYDVRAKYQGSPYNRARGDDIQTWPYPGPQAPTTLKSLSWKIKLPDTVKVDGKSDLYLLKPRDHGCSYIAAYVMYELARQLGLPANDVKFTQFWINGGYYMYAMDVNYYSDDQIEDYINDVYNKECANQGMEKVGLMFKAHGFGCEGPVGPANEEYLYPITCNGATVDTLSRTMQTYDIETQKDWASDQGYRAIVNMTDGLFGPNHVDFSEGSAAGRAWFQENFDVNHMLSYMALVNWGGAWDDLNGNHMIYQRLTDKKWTMVPWDMDSFFGLASPCKGKPSCSLYLGEVGAEVSDNQIAGSQNVLKNAFIKAFRPELNARYLTLANGVMSVENVNAVFDEAMAKFNATQYNAAGGGNTYFFADNNCVDTMKAWHAQRNAYVKSAVSGTEAALSICPSKPTLPVTLTTVNRKPGQPASPYMTATTTNSINLAWLSPNPNGAAITGYKLEYAVNGGSYSTLYAGTDTTYAHGSLSASKEYTYRVTATNANGNSLPSDAITMVPGKFPTDDEDSSAASALTLIPVLAILISLLI
eukprot:TRINITY_DN128_c0_g1_i1.p1 TRINITY_DN128_c0_g1~~TRINITY_DN128_c0_g1_i1.p1  ORF type:complete len:1072 (-),score=346.16 TRINITY_DN128_c0_g1_i1:63-3278(-)